MTSPLSRLADLWISRRAAPDRAALEAVKGLVPAVVITGASRGIGRALAARFAETGHHVVLVARDRTALDKAAAGLSAQGGVRVSTLALDIAHPEAAATIDHFLADRGAYLDVLVNNAGMGLGGPFETASPEVIDALVALNVAAATRLVRHALPRMKARGRGGILNVASLGGGVPGAYQAAYYASKAYLMSLSEAIAAECSGAGVRVTVVAPGPVDTGFHADMGAERALYRLLLPAMSPDAVARSAYRGYVLGRRVVYPGLLAPLMAVSLKMLPHAVSVPLVAWLLDNRSGAGRSDRC